MLNRHQISYISEQELLATPLRDLNLRIQGSWIAPLVSQMHDELRSRNIKFRPHIWTSDDWFCPDGVTGFAIPFYLLHPRLIKLEKKYCLQAEGSTKKWCLQLLRHECAHALDNAFHLRKRKKRQSLFGLSSIDYPEKYQPKSMSKNYVIHLEGHYAQAHPDEDWAETFAVWLNSSNNWKKNYSTWPALKKLEYLDEVMKSITLQRPLKKNLLQVDSLKAKSITLGSYLKNKRTHLQIVRQQRSLLTQLNLKRNNSFLIPAMNREGATFLKRHRSRLTKEIQKTNNVHLREVQHTISEISSYCDQNHIAFTNHDTDQTLLQISQKIAKLIKRKNQTVIM